MNRSNDDLTRTNQPTRTAEGGSNGPNIALIAFGIIAILAVVFFLQNGERTSIDFLFFEKETTKRWSILTSVIFGVVLDRLLSFWWHRRKRKKVED